MSWVSDGIDHYQVLHASLSEAIFHNFFKYRIQIGLDFMAPAMLDPLVQVLLTKGLVVLECKL